MCRSTIKPTWRGWPACSSGQIQCSRRSMRSRRAEAAVARPLIPNPPVRIEVELRLGEKCSLLQAGCTFGQDATDFFCGRPASMAAKSRQPRRPCQGRPLLHLQFHLSWQRCRRKLLPPTLRTVATVGLFTILVPPKVMDGSHRARSFARWQRQASGRPGFCSTSFVGSAAVAGSAEQIVRKASLACRRLQCGYGSTGCFAVPARRLRSRLCKANAWADAPQPRFPHRCLHAVICAARRARF